MTEEERHLLFSAADFSVSSFYADWTADSGTVIDSVAHGIPVCCVGIG